VLAVESSERAGVPPSRSVLVRILYLAPILLLVAFAAAFVNRHLAEQAWLAAAYAAAEDAVDAGDLVSAREGFQSLIDYRDADARVKEVSALLQPLEEGYANGLRAIERGDYEAAVQFLEPVADQAPTLADARARLVDARRLLGDELLREADAAETARDWSAAERILARLVGLDPASTATRSRLGTLQREHGPIVLGNDRQLWLVSPDGSESRLLVDALQIIWPVWSPDRSQIAFLAPDPEDPLGNVSVYVADVDASEPRRLAGGVSAHAAPAWSPDGASIAYTSFAGYDPIYETGSIGVRIVDVATGGETDLTGGAYTLAFNPTWSPDGERIAFVVKHQGLDKRPQHSPGDVVVATLGSETFENLTEGAVRDVWSASWSPRGDQLLLFSLFGQTWYEPPSTSIRQLNLTDGNIEQIASIEENPTAPVWSPDGSRFVYTVEESHVVIAGTGSEPTIVEIDAALSGEITWSPDGLALLLAPWDANESSTLIDLTGPDPARSEVRLEFDASPPFISPPQWAPAVALPPEENPSMPVSIVAATPAPNS
jgi:Tol biopolymer transport system component